MFLSIAFLYLTPAHLTIYFSLIIFLIVCLPFLLKFFDNSLTFSGLLPAHLFPVSKASIASNSFPTEHAQFLMPSSVTELFFLNFFHHNITTRNSLPSCSQMFRPHTFVNITLTHLTIIIHILNTYYYHFKNKLKWPSDCLIQLSIWLNYLFSQPKPQQNHNRKLQHYLAK